VPAEPCPLCLLDSCSLVNLLNWSGWYRFYFGCLICARLLCLLYSCPLNFCLLCYLMIGLFDSVVLSYGPWYTGTHGYQWGGVWKGFWVLAICVVLVLLWCWYPMVNGLECSFLILAWVSVVLSLVWTNTTLDQFDPCSFCVELLSGLPNLVPVRNSGVYQLGDVIVMVYCLRVFCW
jgi:hypothetical protein